MQTASAFLAPCKVAHACSTTSLPFSRLLLVYLVYDRVSGQEHHQSSKVSFSACTARVALSKVTLLKRAGEMPLPRCPPPC